MTPLRNFPSPVSSIGAGDSTPGGSSDVWLWEADIGLQWETSFYMTTE